MPTRLKKPVKAMLSSLVILVTAGSQVHCAALDVPFTPGPDQGIFLIISDLHFDPFASSDVVKRLNTAPLDNWKAILDKSTVTAFAQYGADANYPLVMSTIEAAKSINVDYDFILFPGDYVSHDFNTLYQQQVGGNAKQYATFVENTMRFVDERLHHAFPKAPLIVTLGNNDSLCGDYKIAPNSPLLNELSPLWGRRSGAPQAFRDFAVAGFYAMPHPTVPMREIIVLNNILWSDNYQDACNANGGEPGSAQVAWLEWTLYRLKQKGKTATLLMHVPPGVNVYSTAKNAVPGHADCKKNIQLFWADKYANQFEVLVKQYQGILDNGFVGHTHMDDFRVISNADRQPFMFTRISPAVSPAFGNNPAFTVALYDRKTGKLLDYAVYALTNLTQAGSSEQAHWGMEYRFRAAYGLSGVTPMTLDTLSNEIGKGGSTRQKYVAYYAVEAPSGAGNSIKAYQCAQTHIGVDDFASCYCEYY